MLWEKKKCRAHHLVIFSDMLEEAGFLVILILSECIGLQYSSSH